MQSSLAVEASAKTLERPKGQIVYGGQVVVPYLPALELPTEDGIPMESPWHVSNMTLLIDSIRTAWRDRTDYFCGGNMFIYFSLDQARQVAEEVAQNILPAPSHRAFRGPDFFVVLGVDGVRKRNAWLVWEEQGRYPNVIVELQSPSTASYDEGRKKALYEQTFRTPDYFCVDPLAMEIKGWHLDGGRYEALEPNERGQLRCTELDMWLGWWEGVYMGSSGVWARFFDRDGNPAPTFAEVEAHNAEVEAQRAKVQAQRAEAEAQRAEAEAQRAEAEAQRARAAEAENARLRAMLRDFGVDLDVA